MNKLLIIEDDTALAAILSRRLARHGFECKTCDNASDSLLMARQFTPTHIVLDMKLAQSNGLSLIKPLRQQLPHVYMVLLTGFASIATAVEAIRLGADNYLAKPVDTQTLLNALHSSSTTFSAEPDEFEAITEQPLNPKRLEWEHIQQVLANNNGNVSETARQLGMHRRTLQRKLLKKPTADNR
ncbi:response regulator transcription factor [Shewanella litoralis]|uniref:DNA-binding response regulator n=1 Tax=Shewanella litoralis TaxID=2282700 RepID=A0ABQ2QZT0_9GAMM|nr:response regulator [Shewanella litoralis]GGQ06296.1 DNA-binding response regulator [Shewanella litoralis]